MLRSYCLSFRLSDVSEPEVLLYYFLRGKLHPAVGVGVACLALLGGEKVLGSKTFFCLKMLSFSSVGQNSDTDLTGLKMNMCPGLRSFVGALEERSSPRFSQLRGWQRSVALGPLPHF